MLVTSFRRYLLLLIAALLLSPLALADTSREVVASGTGASREAAIVAALLAGARQVPSLSGVSDATLRPLFEGWVRADSRQPVDRTGLRHRMPVATDSAAGIIRDYQVQRVTREAAGIWRADLAITLASYEVRASRERPLVSTFLLPFSVHAEDEAEAGGMEAQAAAQQEMVQIEALRAQVRQVLAGRQVEIPRDDPALLRDPRLLLAFDSPASVPWKELATSLGNEYFVAVDVEDYLLEFRPENPRKKEAAYWRARFVFAWRIVSAADAVVMASGRLRLDRADVELHHATSLEVAGREAEKAVPFIQAVAARRLARQLEERLVPVQVLSTEGDVVVLDTGAVRLVRGDPLAVLGTGLVEREEGASLPVYLDGPRVAVLDTLEVDGPRARARVVRGSAATLLPGAPVRRLAEMPVPRMP